LVLQIGQHTTTPVENVALHPLNFIRHLGVGNEVGTSASFQFSDGKRNSVERMIFYLLDRKIFPPVLWDPTQNKYET
jgi:hypothetical protein